MMESQIVAQWCYSPVIDPTFEKNLSELIESSTHPDWRKLAKIIPMFEKGRSILVNYRLISLLSSLRKVSGKLFRERTMCFV